MPSKRVLTIGTIALVCFFAVLALDYLDPFSYVWTRNAFRDAILRLSRTTPPNPDLVFLAIDTASVSIDEKSDVGGLFDLRAENAVELRALHLMTKSWPWPREVHALALQRLFEAGAKAVIFDLTFPYPSEDDVPFRLALERYQERVVIGSNFTSDDSDGNKADLTRPTESLVPQTVPMDDRVAYTNFWPDEDGIIRSAQYRLTPAQIERRVAQPDEERFLSLAARTLVKIGMADRVPEGLASRRFRYTAPPRQGFPPHSIFEIFVPEYWKRTYKSGDFFRNKIVIIGSEGNWQHDEHPTPFGTMPGPELHLNAINAAIHGEFITDMSRRAVALVTLGAGLLGVLLTLQLRSPWLRLVLFVAVAFSYCWTAVFTLDHFDVYLPCLPGLIEFSITIILGLVCDFTWERIEKNRVRRTLERYVSTNVVREMLDRSSVFHQSVGGVIKPVAVLFSDIRGYSIVSARTDPQALVSQLNEYLGAMVECVFRHGGTLDKFIGDAVMAVWGNVRSSGPRDDTANAVRAALEMRKELARLNRDWKKRGLPEFRIGIAINQGDVVVGNIGSPQRMEFTVIGDAVNVSWRLQELTKVLGSDLIVSQNVTALLVEDFELCPLGRANVAGLDQDLEVYSVLGPIEIADETRAKTSGLQIGS